MDRRASTGTQTEREGTDKVSDATTQTTAVSQETRLTKSVEESFDGRRKKGSRTGKDKQTTSDEESHLTKSMEESLEGRHGPELAVFRTEK